MSSSDLSHAAALAVVEHLQAEIAALRAQHLPPGEPTEENLPCDGPTHRVRWRYGTTEIYDEDGELLLRLPFLASRAQVLAAVYGFAAGHKAGEPVGASSSSTSGERWASSRAGVLPLRMGDEPPDILGLGGEPWLRSMA